MPTHRGDNVQCCCHNYSRSKLHHKIHRKYFVGTLPLYRAMANLCVLSYPGSTTFLLPGERFSLQRQEAVSTIGGEQRDRSDDRQRKLCLFSFGTSGPVSPGGLEVHSCLLSPLYERAIFFVNSEPSTASRPPTRMCVRGGQA